jgi:hypothetical protein
MSEEKVEQGVPDQDPSHAPDGAAAFFNKVFGEAFDRRTRENIRQAYSNSAFFETSELDAKILFGQTNRNFGNPVIDWHTAVTMAWAQAKMLSYYLRLNLAVYEANYGTIKVPAGMLPPTFAAPEDLESNPKSRKLFETIQGIRRELVDEQLNLWPQNEAAKEQ